MGQVSLPVLSRKGKHDDWNYIWTSFSNYSVTFNEDLFLKKFIFLFFMYGISCTKFYTASFFKKPKNSKKKFNTSIYKLIYLDSPTNVEFFKQIPHNKFYVSKIFLCRHTGWIYIYIFIHSVTNIRIKHSTLKKTIKNFNKHLFYQTYLKSKYNYKVQQINKIK